MLVTTHEHRELISQHPDLLLDWKLLCLYRQADDQVKLTYKWLTQADWFDINPDEIDWTLLTYELLDFINQPNDDDYDENGGTFPAVV